MAGDTVGSLTEELARGLTGYQLKASVDTNHRLQGLIGVEVGVKDLTSTLVGSKTMVVLCLTTEKVELGQSTCLTPKKLWVQPPAQPLKKKGSRSEKMSFQFAHK